MGGRKSPSVILSPTPLSTERLLVNLPLQFPSLLLRGLGNTGEKCGFKIYKWGGGDSGSSIAAGSPTVMSKGQGLPLVSFVTCCECNGVDGSIDSLPM